MVSEKPAISRDGKRQTEAASSSQTVQSDRTLYSLTGLRWWAAFGVFFYHMSIFAPIPLLPLFEWGNFGVMFFFVLSGFVLSWSWDPKVKIHSYYQRRFARIWPSAFVALLLAIPVFYSFSPSPDVWYVKQINIPVLLLSVVLIQGWWLNPVILFSGNPAAWTLTVEFFFYFLHPFVMFGLLKRKALWIWMTISFLTVYVLWQRFACLGLIDTGCLQLAPPIQRLPEFLFGVTLGLLAGRGLRLRIPPVYILSLLITYVLGTVLMQRFSVGGMLTFIFKTFSNEIILALCILLIFSYASRDARGASSWMRSRLFVKLGELSFTFYLVHATVMYAFIRIWGQLVMSWDNIWWYLPVLAVGMVLAFVLHTYIEKPFNRIIRNWRGPTRGA